MKLRNLAFLLGTAFTIVSTLAFFTGCIYKGSPTMILFIENRTQQVLTISLDQSPLGDVSPGSKLAKEPIGYDYFRSREHILEAKNAEGQIVLSRKFNYEDLQQIGKGERQFLMVISQIDLEGSDNITGDNASGR